MSFREIAKAAIRSIGMDVVGFDPRFYLSARKLKLLRALNAEAFLDVGANTGQFAKSLRTSGWRGQIHSFEPGSVAYKSLSASSAVDKSWSVHKAAVGSATSTMKLNVSGDSFSSSLRVPSEHNTNVHAGVRTTKVEAVDVVTLDQFVADQVPNARDLAVKIDTQGYEAEVIAGALQTLRKTSLLICEFSVKEMYLGQELFHQLMPRLVGLGFYPTIFEACDEDYSSYEVLQIDVWFLKTGLEKAWRA